MCLVPGLADGRYLLSNELLPEELAVDVDCHCGPSTGAGHPGISRRKFMVGAGVGAAGLMSSAALGGGAASAAAPAPTGPMPPADDRVVMLGLNGGPVLSPVHSQPSLALIVNGSIYLVDCGGDSARQLINANLPFALVRHVFLTHHHIDHSGGYPEFALLGWLHSTGEPLVNGVQLWAPPPIKHMQAHLLELFRLGIHLHQEIGSPPFAPLIRPRELALPKHGIVKVMEDENVTVHATRVFHGPEVHDAYAYRFDIKRSGRSVAFSGDTVPNQQLIALAEGADLLVHEAQMNANIPRVVAQVAPSQQSKLARHLESSHTNVTDVPRVAKAANAKRVAMCHYALGPDPQAFLAAAQSSAATLQYTGEIITPRELDAIPV